MRKNKLKHHRVNSYKVNHLNFNGEIEELTFQQGYDASTDAYNPFFIRVYNGKGQYLHSASASTIEGAYNALITSLIRYKLKAEDERNDANSKLSQIFGIVKPESDDEEYDDRF